MPTGYTPEPGSGRFADAYSRVLLISFGEPDSSLYRRRSARAISSASKASQATSGAIG